MKTFYLNLNSFLYLRSVSHTVFLNLFSCRPLGTEGEILALSAALRITSATALLNPPRILDGEGRRMIYCPAVATQKILAPHKRARSGARGNQRRMREF